MSRQAEMMREYQHEEDCARELAELGQAVIEAAEAWARHWEVGGTQADYDAINDTLLLAVEALQEARGSHYQW